MRYAINKSEGNELEKAITELSDRIVLIVTHAEAYGNYDDFYSRAENLLKGMALLEGNFEDLKRVISKAQREKEALNENELIESDSWDFGYDFDEETGRFGLTIIR
jgi:DNA polymerase III sliding clamp (beta) subunit (PCNA family)